MKFFFLALMYFMFTFPVIAQENRETQLWNINSVSVKIWDRTSVEMSEKIVYSTESSGIATKYGDIWLKHNTDKWFKYGTGLRLSYNKSDFGWNEERRLMAIGEFIKNIEEFKFILSNRFAYRWFEQAQRHFRYRQKLDITFPSFTPLNLKFYTGEEVFIKINSENLHIARIYAGLNAVDKTHFRLKVYYIFEKRKFQNQWNPANIFGLNMNILL